MMGQGRGTAAGRKPWTVMSGRKQVGQGGGWGPRCCHLPHMPAILSLYRNETRAYAVGLQLSNLISPSLLVAS